MKKQEEIREGIRNNFLIAIDWADKEGMTDAYLDLHIDELLKFLHSQGVVIKVDKQLYDIGIEYYNENVAKMLKAGYVAVEPIIEN